MTDKSKDFLSIDAYTPAQIASRVEQASLSKTSNSPLKVFVLAVLAGSFIAFGAALYILTTHDAGGLSYGLNRLIGGLAFSLGLILVIVAGAELFTGNNLLVIACIDKKITFGQLLKNWVIVYFGNFCGSVFVVFLIYQSGHWLQNNAQVGAKTVETAIAKTQYDMMSAFFLGVLCNILVCLAVWLCFAARSVTDKVFAIIFPVAAFVAMGFEHSIANMYFIPAGLSAMEFPEVVNQLSNAEIAKELSISTFIVNNLMPVTLGNIVGGSLFVGCVYYFIYVFQREN